MLRSLLIFQVLASAAAFTSPLASPSVASLRVDLATASPAQGLRRVSAIQMSQEAGSTTDNETEEEFHPIDPARTTTEFLAGLWQLIAKGNTMVRGVSSHQTYILFITFVFCGLTSFALYFRNPTLFFSQEWNLNSSPDI